MEANQILGLIVLLGLIFSLMWGFKTALSTTKYKKAVVKQVQNKDVCDDVCDVQSYFIEYECYFLGFIPVTVKFYKEECDWGDCYEVTITAKSVKNIIKKFNEHVKSVRRPMKSKTIQDVKDTCDE